MGANNIFSCTWNDFEALIREKIDGNFYWNVRPFDSKDNREAVIESIEKAIRNNSGIFPDTDGMYLEKLN
ncbi:MAG: hypothetical protein JRJ39_14900 [Deltaproteobacteria bacterium]|nr:hypothetical protein [Deltaproteobacteria bacterium]MBW2365813.1 hypothetical protein [Deltaproteobacteria bacterium]